MYLEKINGPEDVKKIKIDELPVLAQEIRDALLVRASKHGGHFGPNFGMVEATIALHYVFESPKDKIVYDLATSLTKGDTLQGSYMKWQYIYNVGPDPNMYWFHTFFYATTDRNAKLALGCQATYSPPKPGDQYQD